MIQSLPYLWCDHSLCGRRVELLICQQFRSSKKGHDTFLQRARVYIALVALDSRLYLIVNCKSFSFFNNFHF
ncbi:hypothetical protein NPIL_381691 [Nephila pilipes]|uniref:Uncharacterized protein n=1 Tax=Nephila pilipes TaxID=299642 RepID=A0A8X6QFA0_NEPPI|nr:hypothetical protein NPIL_381691 [Nephila pilipes]